MIWEWKTIVLAMVKSVPLQSWVPVTKQTKADFTILQTEAKGEPGQLKQPIKINGFKLILGACTLPLQQWQRKADMTRMNGLRNTCYSTVMRLWISRTTENQGKLHIRHEKINKYINLFFFCQESLFIMFTCCCGFNRLNSFPVFNKNDSTRILHLTKGPEWRCSEGSGGSYALPLNHMLKTLILPVPSHLPTERL